MRSVKEIFMLFVYILLTLCLIVVLSPFLLSFYIYSFLKDTSFKNDYNHYLRTIEGKKIFCYNSRTNSNSYIKKNILPLLSPETEIVYLNGKIPITSLEKKYISHALYSIKERNGFPYLLKIENGKLIDHSINNEFYNTMNQNKDIKLLIEEINSFYQTT